MAARPISVLHFTNTLVRAGVEEHILTLLRSLDRALFQLRLACPPELAEKLQPDLPADVEIIPLLLESPSQVIVVRRLARVVGEMQIDILHSHLFQSSRVASPIGWVCRVPVIVETPHVRELWRRGWLKGNFAIDRLVGRCVDYYVAVSEANARYLAGEKGLPSRKIVTIHNGVDLTRFDPARVPPAGMRHSLGFGDADPVVVVLARLEPQKGHQVLLEALPLVRREFPRVRLVCVGDGSLRNDLEALSRSSGFGEAVRFVGYQANPVDWLALADFTVLPSHFEGLPIAAIESLAMGKPVVASDVDGTGEVVVHEKTGLMVPAGQPDRLAEGICRLLRDPGLSRRLGRAGRELVIQHFSQEQQVRKTEGLYLEALRRSAGRETMGERERAERDEVRACTQAAPSAGQQGDP